MPKIDRYVLHARDGSITEHFNFPDPRLCGHAMSKTWSCTRAKGHEGKHFNAFKTLTDVDHFEVYRHDGVVQNHYLASHPKACVHHMRSLRGCTREIGHDGLHFNCFGGGAEWADDAGQFVTSQTVWVNLIDRLGKEHA